VEKIKINDRRSWSPDYVPEPKEACRVCGSSDVHSTQYSKPTMGCIEYLRKEISVAKAQAFVMSKVVTPKSESRPHGLSEGT
jgi:hypothetical protein